MTETTKSFAGLDKSAAAPAPAAEDRARPVHVQKIDAHGRAYATGKRKNAVARVWVKPGVGKITINDRDHEVYFARPVLQMILSSRSSRRTAPRNTISSPPCLAADCPAKPVLCAMGFPRR